MPLIVVIENPPQPILPARARAELVASLRAVDYVMETRDGIRVDVHLEEEDCQRFGELLTHVHARQRGASE